MTHIVLVEPEIPQNTGNIARTCTAIGAKLHIVRPIPFDISDKSVQRAGLDYWQYLDLEVHESLDAFLAKHAKDTLYFCSTKAKSTYSSVEYPKTKDVYLLFGAESRGLPEDLIFSDKGTAITIPMLPHIRSLNLSNSVAIIAYEVERQKSIGK
ncbi:MAG: tRNA (cytidine(34)-2'-O)-methyltransferase [Clostridiales bacterium]|jgi:tRNA (cytidine/uridine-2'-O-)-methyltransferase|nr:tRNA (cytidine(34)-2'-O)-methyltransferase [Clostridiales bacterium]